MTLLVNTISMFMEIKEFLNLYFKDAWFHTWTYNLQVGSDKDQYLYGDLDWYEAFQGILRSFITLLIINHGPPNASIVSGNNGGFFMTLSWEEILLRKPILKQTYQVSGRISLSCCHLYPYSRYPRVGDVVKELPDVAIHVLAHSHLVLIWCNWNATPTFLYPSFDPLTSRRS